MLKGAASAFDVSTTVSGLSLDSYVQMYKALNKTSPVNECYFKVQDLRQLLCIHGLSATKLNRTELLRALHSKPLVNPFSHSVETTDVEQQPLTTAADGSNQVQANSNTTGHVELTGADLSVTGWVETGAEVLIQPIHQLQVDLLGVFSEVVSVYEHTTASGLAEAGAALPFAVQKHQQHASVAGTLQDGHQRDQVEDKGTSDARVTPPAVPMQQLPSPAAGDGLHAGDGWRTAKRARKSAISPLLQHQPPTSTDSAPLQAATTAPPITVPQHRFAAVAAPAAVVTALQSQATSSDGRKGSPHLEQKQQDALQPDPALQDLVHAPGYPDVLTHQDLHAHSQSQGHQQQAVEQAESADEPRDGHAAHLADNTTAPEAANLLLEYLRQADLHVAPPEWPLLHTHRLLKQLQLFAATGATASQEALITGTAAATALGSSRNWDTDRLLGRHVGFVLTEEMFVAGPKNTQLALPAGVYQGRIIKYLGSACRPELCEPSCPGGHQHYRARVLPPQVPDRNQVELLEAEDVAASITRAHAAASGRPVLLILDLHPDLRVASLSSMLRLEAEKLQDAWILLRGEDSSSS